MQKHALLLSAALLGLIQIGNLRCTQPTSPPTPTAGSTNNGYFKVTAPYGGFYATMETMTDIRWSLTGAVTDQYVTISLYQGDSLVSVIASSASNTGDYSWYPSVTTSGDQYRIQIASSSDPSKFDFGPYFSIHSQYSGTLRVTTPVSGSTATIGSSLSIAWSATGSVGGYVKLELYQDTTFVTTITSEISTSTTGGSYTWYSVSTTLGSGSKYRVKVSSYYDNGIYAYSSYFTVASPYSGTFTVTNPTDSSTLSAGSYYYIQWTSTGNPGTYVKIDLYRDTTLYATLSTETNNSGSYYWTTQSGYPSGSNYRIKISSYYDAGVYSFSGRFTIAGVAPDQYEPDNSRSTASKITFGTVQNHTLDYNDTDWVQFSADSGTQYLLRNSGATATVTYLYFGDSLASSTNFSSSSGNPGYVKWTCPRKGEYYARITPSYSGSSGSYSVGVSVYDSTTVVTFTAPDSQTVWSSGSSYTILWKPDSGLLGSSVRISLLNPATKALTNITTYASNTGIYSWTLPSGMATLSAYRVQVGSYSNSGIYGYSPPFTISGILPDSFEVDDSLRTASTIATDGTVQNRTLTLNDNDWISFAAVKDSLYVIHSQGTPLHYVYVYAGKDSASYSTYQSGTSFVIFWKATVTGTAYLKIFGTSTSQYGSYTVSVKRTDPSTLITFVNPTLNSTWSTGSSYTLQWIPDTALFGPYVSLSLAVDQKPVQTITSNTANNGTYAYVIPQGLASGNKYRILMYGYMYGYSASFACSGPFTISGMMPDSFEIDDSLALSKPITTDGTPQARDLTLGDIDWINFTGQTNKLYVIEAACSLSTTLKFYNTDGTTLLQTATGSAAADAKIVWFCTVAGKYYLSMASSQVGNYRAMVTACDSTMYRFNVSAPVAGGSFAAGATMGITWTQQVGVGGFVDIFLYNSAGIVQTVVANVANTGQYYWVPAAATTPGSDYYIKIISRYNSSILGYSGIFTITAP